MQSVKRAQNSKDKAKPAEAEELRQRARNCNRHGIDTTNRTETTHRNDVFLFYLFHFVFGAAIGAYDSILFSAKTTWQNCEELSSVQLSWAVLACWLADWLATRLVGYKRGPKECSPKTSLAYSLWTQQQCLEYNNVQRIFFCFGF